MLFLVVEPVSVSIGQGEIAEEPFVATTEWQRIKPGKLSKKVCRFKIVHCLFSLIV